MNFRNVCGCDPKYALFLFGVDDVINSGMEIQSKHADRKWGCKGETVDADDR